MYYRALSDLLYVNLSWMVPPFVSSVSFVSAHLGSGARFSKVPVTFRARKLFYERKLYLKDSIFC